MPKRLLEKLGLRRRHQADTPAVVKNPVHGQQSRLQQTQQQQQQQATARTTQQQPSGPTWVDGSTAGRKVKVGPLNRDVVSKQKSFVKRLDKAMPLVRKAKQFALTVDGQRIEVANSKEDAQFKQALSDLADKLTSQIKDLDDCSSTIRKKVEAFDFDAAKQELDKAVDLATRMLSLENSFRRLLSDSGKTVPKSLAGDRTPSPEEREYEQVLEESQATFDTVLGLESNNATVRVEQKSVRAVLKEARRKASEEDFAGAIKLVEDAARDCLVIEALAKAHQDYEERLSELRQLVAVVQSIDPVSKAADGRKAALALLVKADADAAKGNFPEAITALDQFEQVADKLVPHEDRDAQLFPEAVESIRSLVETALAVDVPCKPVMERTKVLADLLPASEKAAKARDFRQAFQLIDDAFLLANNILINARSFNEYSEAEQKAQIIFQAAAKLELDQNTQSDKIALQKSVATQAADAAKFAKDGKFAEADEKLKKAVTKANQLLSDVHSPALLDFYEQWAAVRPEVDAAASLKSRYQLAKDAKASLAEARMQMEESANSGDIQGASFMLSIVETRANELRRIVEVFDDYERAEKSFAGQFAIAQAADAKIPGVAALQQQLAAELAAAAQALAADPAAAKKLLFKALGLANRIASLAEQFQRQQERQTEMTSVLKVVKASYLPAGSADNLIQSEISDGPQFDAVLDAMKAAEQARDDNSLNQLEAAARTWLTVFDRMSADQKADSKVLRRRQICETAIKQAKHLRLANQFEALGAPPWSQDQEDRAADIYVTMSLESGDLPLESARGGVTGAEWIKEMDWGKGEGKRRFIFKRTDIPPERMAGFPENGEAPREVLGDEVGRKLKAMTGIDFNVPETRIVSIDGSKLPGGKAGTPIAGSAQAAAPTIGNVGDVYWSQPEVLKEVPARELQKMAIFDMVSLNMDRHQDNFLITPKGPGKPPQMVPIDNGLAFPSREGLNARRGKYAGGKAIEWFPNAYELFDDDMLVAIDAIDPDEIVAGLQARLDAMDQEHPELQVKTKVAAETFDMIRNSVAFMKAAARELSPVFLLDALMNHGDDLLFGTLQERAEKTKEVIETSKKNQEAYAPFAKMDFKQKQAIYKVHYEGGWALELSNPGWSIPHVFEWDAWGRRNPENAVAIYSRKLDCPVTVRENAELLAEIKRLDPNSTIASIHGKNVREAHDVLVDAAGRLRKKERQAEVVAKINARFSDQLEFGKLDDAILSRYERMYRNFVRWGGDQMTKIRGKPFKKLPFETAYKQLYFDVGRASDQNYRLQLAASPEFAEMNELLEMCERPLADPEQDDLETLIGQFDRFRELKQLGGIKAMADAGFDLQMLDTYFEKPLKRLKFRAAEVAAMQL